MSLKRDVLKICHEYDLGDDIRHKIEEAIDSRIGSLDRYDMSIVNGMHYDSYVDNELSILGDWVKFEDLEDILD